MEADREPRALRRAYVAVRLACIGMPGGLGCLRGHLVPLTVTPSLFPSTVCACGKAAYDTTMAGSSMPRVRRDWDMMSRGSQPVIINRSSGCRCHCQDGNTDRQGDSLYLSRFFWGAGSSVPLMQAPPRRKFRGFGGHDHERREMGICNRDPISM